MPEIVCEFVDEPDAHLTNLGSKGLGEPPIVPTAAAIANAIRDATGADVTSLPITARRSCGRSAKPRRPEGRSPLQLERPSSRERSRRGARRTAAVALAGGTELVPLLRDGLVTAERARRRLRRAAARDRRADDRRRHDARRARGRSADPGGAARGLPARRLAAAPQHGHDRRQPAPGDAVLVLAARRSPATCTAATAATRRRASTASTRSSATSSAPRRTPPTPPPRCSRSARRSAPTAASSPLAELYRLPTDDDRATTTLEPGELILELDVPAADVERLPEGDGPEAVGVRARRRRGGTRRRRDADRALGRRADPVAARLAEALDAATPLPGTAYKVEIARALVPRALAAL